MLDRLSNPAKIKAFDLAEELRGLMRPLFKKHQDDIITGVFSSTMMKDWDAGDPNLLGWRAATNDTAFEQTAAGDQKIGEYTGTGLALDHQETHRQEHDGE